MKLHTAEACVKPHPAPHKTTKPHPADAPAFHPLPDSVQIALDLGTLALMGALKEVPELGRAPYGDNKAVREMMALGLVHADLEGCLVLTSWGLAVHAAYRKNQGSVLIRLSPNLSTFHSFNNPSNNGSSDPSSNDPSNNDFNNDPSNNGGTPAPVQPAAPKSKPHKPKPAPAPVKHKADRPRRLVLGGGIESLLWSRFTVLNPNSLSREERACVSEALECGVLRKDGDGFVYFTDLGKHLQDLYQDSNYLVSFGLDDFEGATDFDGEEEGDGLLYEEPLHIGQQEPSRPLNFDCQDPRQLSASPSDSPPMGKAARSAPL